MTRRFLAVFAIFVLGVLSGVTIPRVGVHAQQPPTWVSAEYKVLHCAVGTQYEPVSMETACDFLLNTAAKKGYELKFAVEAADDRHLMNLIMWRPAHEQPVVRELPGLK